ncbi:response regulator [Paenibacillus sp. PAMC21692]|uniref:response regulator n=1 Tax=Paenibacillus sp. PAMC21692 TaxID=2762320 RepID=UPI00164E07A7|nr:response regulator [Paenibacillus sp. PAMC21692]QNK54908.1 response regulator [Paenibacillus sp. PAMC21692]
MVRVLVVDDEKEIRKGLVTQLPWKEWGVDEVVDADDGDTALELAKRYPPDLILTDIRMPRMSGLQFIEELISNRYTGGLIVISGYDEFHYAREAMKLGVSDYLLKPISKSELADAVAVSLLRLREQNAEERSRSLLQESYLQAIPRMREELLRELTEQPFRDSHSHRIEQKLRQLNLEWMMDVPLRLIIFRVDSLKALSKDSPHETEELLLGMGRLLEELFAVRLSCGHVLFRSRNDDWILVLGDGDDAESAESLAELSEAACEEIKERLRIRINRGYAVRQASVPELFELHRKATSYLEYYKVHGSLKGDEDLSGMNDRAENQLANAKDLVELLKYGSHQDIRDAMSFFPRLVKTWNVHHPKDLQQRIFEWLLELFRTVQKTTGWKEPSWEKNPIVLWEHLEHFDTLESLWKETTNQLLAAADNIRVQSGFRSQIVHEAQRFILRQYQDNLTLQTVADHVHVTPVWLSKLFKKETEMNFLEYLTDVRMTKAAELLVDLNLKIYQISFMTGYQDPVHFSKLFKKKFGCTPQEYRNSRGCQHE